MLGSLLAVCMALVVGNRIRTERLQMKAHNFQTTLEAMAASGEIAPEQLSASKASDATDDGSRVPREIKRSALTTLNKIGSGAFGDVFRGILDESGTGGVPGYPVAIKTTAHDGEGQDDMIKEATVMAMVPHHDNIVPLIGVVTRGNPMCLVELMCEHGSLLSFVKNRAEASVQLTVADKVMFASDVAKGMAHLVSCHFVHRDLAARNVLVDSVHRCRVADFGLSRAVASSDSDGEDTGDGEGHENEQYYRSAHGQFPVRWTASNPCSPSRPFSECMRVLAHVCVCVCVRACVCVYIIITDARSNDGSACKKDFQRWRVAVSTVGERGSNDQRDGGPARHATRNLP